MKKLDLETLKKILYSCYSKETAYPSCQKEEDLIFLPETKTKDPFYPYCPADPFLLGTIHAEAVISDTSVGRSAID